MSDDQKKDQIDSKAPKAAGATVEEEKKVVKKPTDKWFGKYL